MSETAQCASQDFVWKPCCSLTICACCFVDLWLVKSVRLSSAVNTLSDIFCEFRSSLYALSESFLLCI